MNNVIDKINKIRDELTGSGYTLAFEGLEPGRTNKVNRGYMLNSPKLGQIAYITYPVADDHHALETWVKPGISTLPAGY